MAIPIKERGIRWAESYSGEKSSHLKQEMDSQIGPGAYCRWEGHDPTTGNDYYVVVSPGFSKNHGYHFFAGLRKMPADHGASGKKFANQREAMSHARETWRVPPPMDKPPIMQGYTVDDIRNAPILREIQHKGTNRSPSGSTMASSERPVKIATLRESAGAQLNMQARLGSKVTSDILCYAYKAAPLIGFLPAMLSRKRFMVVDAANVPGNHVVFNEFTGKQEPMSKSARLKPAPCVATYQPPTRKKFDNAIQKGVWTQNKLVGVAKAGADEQGKPRYVVSKRDPYGKEPVPGEYVRTAWRRLRLTPSITFSMKDFVNTGTLWKELKTRFGKYRPSTEYYNPPKSSPEGVPDFSVNGALYVSPAEYLKKRKKLSKLTRVIIRANVRSDVFDEVRATINRLFPRAMVDLTDPIHKTFDVVKSQEGDKFNWDEPFMEDIRVSGSKLMRYDDALLPYAIEAGRRAFTRQEGSTKRVKYLVKDPGEMIAPYASEILEKLGQLSELMSHLNVRPEDWGFKVHAAVQELWPDNPEYVEEIISNLKDSSYTEEFRNFLINISIPEIRDRADAGELDPSDAKDIVERVVSLVNTLEQRTSPTSWYNALHKMCSQIWNDQPGYADELVAGMASPKTSGEFKEFIAQTMREYVDEINDRAANGELAEGDSVEKVRAGIEGIVSSRKAGKRPEMIKAFQSIRHHLMGFRWLAATNGVPLSNDQFIHSYTAARELVDYSEPKGVLDVDEMGIPRGVSAGADITRTIGNVIRPHTAPFNVQFPTEKTEDGYVYAGRRYDPEKGGFVYGPLPEGTPPSQGPETGLKGLPVVIGRTSLMLSTPDGRPFEIDGGEGQRYKTSGPPEAIVEGHYDVLIAPEYSSPKRTDEPMVERSMARFGFVLMFEPHAVEEPSVKGAGRRSGFSLRQYRPRNLISADPETSPEFKGVDPQYGEWDASKDAVKMGNGVYFDNNRAAAFVFANILGIGVSELGPMTTISASDQRIIDAYVRDAIEYANSVDAYRLEKRSVPRRFLDDAGNVLPLHPGASEGDRMMHSLISKGAENDRNLDQKMYEYGKTCATDCTHIDSPSMNVIRKAFHEAVKEAIENPDEAFKKKPAVIFGIAYVDQDGNEVMLLDNNKKTMVFGTIKDAEAHLVALQRMPEYEQQGLYVKPLGEHLMPYFQYEHPEQKEHVLNREKFEKHVYGLPLEPTEARESEMPPEQVKPTAPAPQPVDQPPGVVQPRLGQPIPSPKPGQAPTASVVDRLVALADKLDAKGRITEADAVDRVLRTTCRSQ